MNANVRTVLVVVSLIVAILAVVGVPAGVPLLAIAVILLAISQLRRREHMQIRWWLRRWLTVGGWRLRARLARFTPPLVAVTV